MRVDLEEVERLQDRHRAINMVPLDKIQWFRDGKLVDVTPEMIREWEFIGLSNIDFATTLGVQVNMRGKQRK